MSKNVRVYTMHISKHIYRVTLSRQKNPNFSKQHIEQMHIY